MKDSKKPGKKGAVCVCWIKSRTTKDEFIKTNIRTADEVVG